MSWISEAVIYQVNLRSLAAREPRNAIEAMREKDLDLSPLAYLAQNLAPLKRLGITVLYLMPPYPIGMEARKGIGSPYSIRDFMAVDPEYGTLDELKTVVRCAHERGLKVILDITPNHTSRDHVWTKQHPEYYVRKGSGALFHDYDWSDTAKLNYADPALRKAMVGVYDFWLGCLGTGAKGLTDGVDGFRLDMAHMISDLGFWDEALPVLKGRYVDRELLFLAESYGAANNLDLFSRGFNAAYDDDFYKVCYYLYGVDTQGASRIALSEHAAGNPDFLDKLVAFHSGGIAGAFETALMTYENVIPTGGGPWLARYTDNHDEGRGLYRFGEGAVHAVMQLAFLSGHAIPFLLTGQEFGAINRPSIHERFGACDKGRRVFPDSANRHTTPGPREEPGIEIEGNVFARGADARHRWYTFYRELIRLRKRHRVLREGSFQLLDAGEASAADRRSVVAFKRELARSRLHCAVNFGPKPRQLRRAGDLFTGNRLYGNLDGDILAPFSAVVCR